MKIYRIFLCLLFLLPHSQRMLPGISLTGKQVFVIFYIGWKCDYLCITVPDEIIIQKSAILEVYISQCTSILIFFLYVVFKCNFFTP